MIGWEWRANNPDWVYMSVGVSGIISIRSVAFKVDGAFYRNVEKAEALTSFDLNPYLNWSWGTFRMPTDDFLAMAKGTDIAMQVLTAGGDVVAKFGTANGGAVVNTKLPPFVAKMAELRSLS